MGSFISKEITRTNRNLFVFNMIGFVVVAWLSYKVFINILCGPFDGTTLAKDIARGEHGIRKYFKISLDRFHHADYCERDSSSMFVNGLRFAASEDEVSAYFIEIDIHDKRVLVKSSKEKLKSFKGVLLPLRHLFIKSETDNIKKRGFYDYIIDTTGSRIRDLYIEFIIKLLVLILFLWNIIKSIRRTIVPECHPIYKRLQRYYINPEEVMDKLDKEVYGPKVGRIKKTIITPSWMIEERWFDMKFSENDRFKFRKRK